LVVQQDSKYPDILVNDGNFRFALIAKAGKQSINESCTRNPGLLIAQVSNLSSQRISDRAKEQNSDSLVTAKVV